jgi:hypothetical protein
MQPLATRPHYETDSGVSWPRVPVMVGAALLAASVIGWLFKSAFMIGWYLIALLPAVGAAALGGVMFAVVYWSRCRNRWLAAVVAAVAGVVAYIGYYHFCMVDALPPGAAARFDLLPSYIEFRLQNDVSEEVGKPNVGQQPKKPTFGLNLYAFIFESLIMIGFPVGFAWRAATRAYCLELDQWMQRDLTHFPVQTSAALCQAIDAGTLDEFVAKTPAGGNAQISCQLALEYVQPESGSTFHYPIYATLQDVKERPWYWPRALKHLRRTVLKQVQLDPREALSLRPLFPKLAQLLGTQHEQLRDTPATAGSNRPAQAVHLPGPAAAVAQITPVPEPYVRRVRTKGYAWRVNLIGIIPAIEFFGGIGLVAWGIWLLTHQAMTLGVALITVGAVATVFGGYTALYCVSAPENRWIERRLRHEISLRPDAMVDGFDQESVYVSIIPRDSFTKIKLTMSSDLLLLKLDKRRRELLMEGDSDRYRIPAGAISVCEPQCFFHPADAHQHTQLWMVRLLVQAERGLQELLVSVANTSWGPMTNKRRRQIAEAMCAEITGMQSAV